MRNHGRPRRRPSKTALRLNATSLLSSRPRCDAAVDRVGRNIGEGLPLIRTRRPNRQDRREASRVRSRRRNLHQIRRNPSAGASSASAAPRFSTIVSTAVSQRRRSGRRGRKSEGRVFPVDLALGAFTRGFHRKGSRFRPPASHSGYFLQQITTQPRNWGPAADASEKPQLTGPRPFRGRSRRVHNPRFGARDVPDRGLWTL